MAISNHASEAEQAAETERVWQEFWRPIVERPDGSIDMEQVKRELHDVHWLVDHCEKAYYWMTNGRVSKCNTEPETVIAIAEDIRNEDIAEATKELEEQLNHALKTADQG